MSATRPLSALRSARRFAQFARKSTVAVIAALCVAMIFGAAIHAQAQSAPAIATLSPATATAGGLAFTMTVNGTGFVNGATVNFNGSGRLTTFVSATQLTAVINAGDIASAGWDQITVTNPGSGASNAVAFTVNSGSTSPTIGTALGYVPVTPCRLVDTRTTPDGPFAGPSIATGTSRNFTIPQNTTCNIPSTAAAYSLNVAVIPSTSLGFLTLWPAGQTQPVAATVSSTDGRVRSNAAIVPAGTGGAISAFASNTTDLVMDIDGYFTTAPTALEFYPVTPCRVVDTRNATGSFGGPSITANTSRTFPLPTSSCNLPATAQAYSLNLTAVPQGPLGFLTAWPAGQTQPGTANLSSTTGTVTASAAIVPAGTSGSIDAYASNTTDLVIDVDGYFAPAGTGGLSLYTLPPCRVLDSRQLSDAQTTQPFSGELDENIQASACGVPVGAQAYVLNATAVPSTPLGFLTLWPQGTTQPLAATLSALDATVTSNLAIVPTTNGAISTYAANPTQLIMDLFGYFAPTTTYTVGGKVSGLSGSGLVLQDDSGNNLSVSAGATTFTFPTAIFSGASYSITVLTQPSSPAQNCVVTNGSGTASANVSGVQITCTTRPVAYTIGGTISGLSGAGLILQDNGVNSLSVSAGTTAFTFSMPVASGGSYSVTVYSQPLDPEQTCVVTNGSGTATANVKNVSVACTTIPTVTVTPSSSSVTRDQGLTVTITVSGGNGSPTPTGTVTLTSGSYTSATTTLTSGSTAISIPAGSLPTGTDTLTVTYSGDSNYSPAVGTNSVSVTVPASGYGILYNFCSVTQFGQCVDGVSSKGGLIRDATGKLYGTTYEGGANNGAGTVFKVDITGHETVLYNFCSTGGSACTDGKNPVASLIQDPAGNLYGTTEFGGAYGNAGTVFKLDSTGHETVLYNFCTTGGTACTDGSMPTAGLVQDAAGNLYGTTSYGGVSNYGTVFKIDSTGHETLLYSFCSAGSPCGDGVNPVAGLIQDAAGNFYGTTRVGGANDGGTVFEVDPRGHETVLYSFCSVANCVDGEEPEAGLIRDAEGNLYGTTSGGGANVAFIGGGTVFVLDTTDHMTVLYNFCSTSGMAKNCTDGLSPQAGLIQDAAGNLYGTTPSGGANGGGTVFKVDPTGHETVIYSFCSAMGTGGCTYGFTDGFMPLADLIQDGAGNLYGTTVAGGANRAGTVFEITGVITPSAPAEATAQPSR